MILSKTAMGFEREPYFTPFGFKGGYCYESWQVAVSLENELGEKGVGQSCQGVLWSDAQVFAGHSASGGNSLMLMITDFAVQWLKGREFADPIQTMEELYPLAYEYGQTITGLKTLRKTFALNALVPVDFALWRLYAAHHGISSFDGLIPAFAKPALAARQEKLAAIPLVTYALDMDAVGKLVEEGAFFMKIKIGSDPEGDNDPDKMLAWDKQRITDIHTKLAGLTTPYTKNGRIPYYLDANGRYDSKDRMMRLLDHADSIGALERIIIFEEPFPEDMELDVSDVPVRLAADESAHSSDDVRRLLDMGYSALALKPIAKTLSMTFKILREAHARSAPCFCADLTVGPLSIDWNKNVAARLAPLPGMTVGALESNGHQYYANWEAMKTYHPMGGASWAGARGGLFVLGDDFYTHSGGVFEDLPHYEQVTKTM
ncbi:MAG: hypothetical protein FWH01_02820 [Oscillospiraceae bacterium]|nr:hypothetical protein [Oscillospiraceae bacterium]